MEQLTTPAEQPAHKIDQGHDKFVGQLLSNLDVVRDLLRHHLPPAVLAKLDLSTLATDLNRSRSLSPRWKGLHSDYIFSCKAAGDEKIILYIAIEHQSTQDPFMPVRIMRYLCGMLEKELNARKKKGSAGKKLPVIIPLVLYHGQKRWSQPTAFHTCFQDPDLMRSLLLEPMLIADMQAITDEEITADGGADLLLRLLLKYARSKRLIKQFIKMLEKKAPEVLDRFSEPQKKVIFEYVLSQGQGTKEDFERIMRAAQTAGRTSTFLSMADFIRGEGRQQGIQQGIQQTITSIIHRLFSQGMLEQNIADTVEVPVEQVRQVIAGQRL